MKTSSAAVKAKLVRLGAVVKDSVQLLKFRHGAQTVLITISLVAVANPTSGCTGPVGLSDFSSFF